jgi:hypothetical protein
LFIGHLRWLNTPVLKVLQVADALPETMMVCSTLGTIALLLSEIVPPVTAEEKSKPSLEKGAHVLMRGLARSPAMLAIKVPHEPFV